MQTDKNTPSPALMDEYRRQMLEMHRRAAPAPTPPAEDNWLDSRYPEPHFQQDRAAMAPQAEEPPQPEPPTPPEEPQEPTPDPPIAESPFVGYLRVFTFTGDGAEPISGAWVTVSRGNTLYANTETNRDGYTPVIPLPSVDPDLTLQPGNFQPYIAYTIRVNADGFRPVRHDNVPVYGNNYVTLPVTLLPLLPGADPDAMQNYTSGGPANL